MNILKRLIARNDLLSTLVSLKGNERACLWLEPLWGIPYNLYIPYVSVFMYALGMNALQIGTVTSVFFASQMFWAVLSGVLTDKLGRRKCTVIFDMLSWSVPTLMWMCAQNYYWFIVAALFNGMWRVTENSWGLLLTEESASDRYVKLYSITHVAGLVAGFFAPAARYFVGVFGVVPTMRVLYFITFVMMTAKFLILYFLSHETAIGERRMREFKDVSIFRHFLGCGRVLKSMFEDKKLLLTICLLAAFTTMKSIGETFWPLLVTKKLGIADEDLSIFSAIKSLLMLFFYFAIIPKINMRRLKMPMLLSFALLFMTQVMYIFMPDGAYWLVVVGVVLEAASLATLNPITSSLQMINADPEERARVLGLFYAMSMLVTSPFGIVAGALAQINWVLPFVLSVFFIIVAAWAASVLWRRMRVENGD